MEIDPAISLHALAQYNDILSNVRNKTVEIKSISVFEFEITMCISSLFCGSRSRLELDKVNLNETLSI